MWKCFPLVRLGYVTEMNWPIGTGKTPYRGKASAGASWHKHNISHRFDVLGLLPNRLAFSSFCFALRVAVVVLNTASLKVLFVQISPDAWKKSSQTCGFLVGAIFFFLTPEIYFERWTFETYGESSWRDVDAWMKFLNKSTACAVFPFVLGFSCCSLQIRPVFHLWSWETCLYFIINLKLNFVSRKRPTKKAKRRKPQVLDSARKCCELIGQKW